MAKCGFRRKDEEKALLTFLHLTKEGKYVPVEKSADAYARIKAEDQQVEGSEETYYYGVS